MINYLKKSFARKKARRVTQEYPPAISTFKLIKEGEIEFANWTNPLVLTESVKQEQVDFFKPFIPKGSLAIDIGANIGAVTVPMALAAGTEGMVMAFDPNPYVFKILEKNAGLNKDKLNIKPLNLAISDEDGEYYYTSGEASFGNGGITKELSDRHGKFTYPEKIKGVNLEQLLEKEYSEWVPKLSFIKIDAEGYDKEIVKSINGLIQKTQPVIVAECFGKNTPEEKMELFEVIANNGYELYYFEEFETGLHVERINAKEDMPKRSETFNVYAIPLNKTI